MFMVNEIKNDIDPVETREWLDALQAVVSADGSERAAFLLQELLNHANAEGINLAAAINTPFRNTIKPHEEKQIPPDEGMANRISALIRWNAVAMVLRAGKYAPELGGHIASYASASTLYETGFNHFFKGANDTSGGDLLYIQGHSSPGIYARAFLEGRLSEQQLDKFRQEVEVDGLSSYPHPWLMGDFWQFPTVSMGLGPLQAIYQARFLKYMENRHLIKAEGRKVWAFLGDGETDEPESLGALSIASKEKLDNLIFVINCNLQRLDGPVRGNGKIIQDLEGVFRGAGWNVIKVVWGGRWDPLFTLDKHGVMQKRMEECVDGDFQSYKANDGAFVREHFFGKYPELKKMVEHLSDDEIWRLNRGGHDAQKVFAAYAQAVTHEGRPTVILAHTVKGYGMGSAGEGMNITHQQKKMTLDQLRAFRDRFSIPVSDEHIADIPFYKPADDSPEIKYQKTQQHR
jgi:pyruvate dehydrogenase E1 component